MAGLARRGNLARHLFRSRARAATSTHGIGRSVFDDELTPIEVVILWMYQSSRCVLRTREIDKCEPGFSPSEFGNSGDVYTYPLHRPLSSKVPIRIFRIQGSCGAPTSTSSPAGLGIFFGCARCAARRPLIESTVVLNPRLPKKSVGAGGCFCTESIFRATEDRFFPCVTASSPAPAIPLALGRPSKSSPRGRIMGYGTKRAEDQVHAPSLMRRRRPSRGDSVLTIAAFLASNVAKSTYAKLRSKS